MTNDKFRERAQRHLAFSIYNLSFSAAYTLIEILVVLTIISLLFTFGFANFREFSQRQALAGIARSLKGDLRLAQESALAGKKPADAKCASPNVLDGYHFRVTGGTVYVIEAACGGAGGGNVQVKSVDLAKSGVTIAMPSHNPIVFKSLGHGTDISQAAPDSGKVDVILSQVVTGNTQMISVTSGGEIR